MGGRAKLTREIFIERSNAIHSNSYSYESVNFVTTKIPVQIYCSVHGLFWQLPYAHLQGNGCIKCAVKFKADKLSYSTEEFVSKAIFIHQNNYSYDKTKYVRSNQKIIITCTKHGDFKQTPNAHLSGRGCEFCGNRLCASKLAMDTSSFIVNARKIHGDSYNYQYVNYINTRRNISIVCKKHATFSQNPASHLTGRGCPICSESKGEKLIREYLNSNNISFLQQYKIADCKNINTLPFDFAILKADQVLGLIEYQGKQHYKPFNFGSKTKTSEEVFKILKKTDDIKNKYCKDHKIPLLLIPYWDKQILEEKLDSFIRSL